VSERRSAGSIGSKLRGITMPKITPWRGESRSAWFRHGCSAYLWQGRQSL